MKTKCIVYIKYFNFMEAYKFRVVHQTQKSISKLSQLLHKNVNFNLFLFCLPNLKEYKYIIYILHKYIFKLPLVQLLFALAINNLRLVKLIISTLNIHRGIFYFIKYFQCVYHTRQRAQGHRTYKVGFTKCEVRFVLNVEALDLLVSYE